MRIHLGGHLDFYRSQKQAWFNYELTKATPLTEVVAQLHIPLAEIALIIVNDTMVDFESTFVNNADTLQIYPPSDGG